MSERDSVLLRNAIDSLLDSIDDAADGQEAWREYGPYRLILQCTEELRKTAQPLLGLRVDYAPNELHGEGYPDHPCSPDGEEP